MSIRPSRAVALTIGGSDSGGGAGCQADLKVFAALGVHGTSAVTCVTAQNPAGVRAIQACRPAVVRAQIEAVFDELRPRAVKTGMLYSAPIIREVSACLRAAPRVPVVVDPVMIATSGACLLRGAAGRAMEALLGLATLVTPNLDEARALTGLALEDIEGLRGAARWLHARHGCAALVKGGHLRGGREAVDIFFDGRDELLLSAPFVRGVSTHGTGCTYSAAITAGLAYGATLTATVRRAKEYITGAIARSYRVERHQALDPLWCVSLKPGCAPRNSRPSV